MRPNLLTRTKMVAVAVALALPVALQPQTVAKSTLLVGVADVETGEPLEGAEVRISALSKLLFADQMGQVRIVDVPAGVHRVEARKLGFEALGVDVLFGRTDSVETVLLMRRVVRRLNAVEVVGEKVPAALQEFESRRRTGIGRYLTAKDLTDDRERDFTSIVRSRFPGVIVMTGRNGSSQYLVNFRGQTTGALTPDSLKSLIGTGASTGQRALGGRQLSRGTSSASNTPAGGNPDSTTVGCRIQVYLDGVVLVDPDVSTVRSADLEGVEFYDGMNTPAQFRRAGSHCGVLLLWTKWRG
jgi:hypothetical protein